jgi:hypothetical protein
MEKEVGNKIFGIWLLGDSNPNNWQDILVTPFDPRHPARHSIWTPVLDVIQDRVFRVCKSRVDTTSLYIRNAIEDPNSRPSKNAIDWNKELNREVEDLSELLYQHRPTLLLCFGAFSFEFARRALKEEPKQKSNNWGAKTLGEQFKQRMNEFEPTKINAIPLLHTSISRGRFIESHNYFSGQDGGNYFEFVGNSIADKLIQYQTDLPIWIE